MKGYREATPTPREAGEDAPRWRRRELRDRTYELNRGQIVQVELLQYRYDKGNLKLDLFNAPYQIADEFHTIAIETSRIRSIMPVDIKTAIHDCTFRIRLFNKDPELLSNPTLKKWEDKEAEFFKTKQIEFTPASRKFLDKVSTTSRNTYNKAVSKFVLPIVDTVTGYNGRDMTPSERALWEPVDMTPWGGRHKRTKRRKNRRMTKKYSIK